MGDNTPRDDRKPIGLLVKLKHSDVESFVESFATNISTSGMFLRTRKPHPKGTPLKFEVRIGSGERVLRGLAEVRWAREDGDPEAPPGMGLKFQALDSASKEMVRRLLAEKQAQEGLDGGPAADETPPPARPAPSPSSPAPAGPSIAMDALGFELEGDAVEVAPAPAPRTPAPAGPAIDMDALGFELEGGAVDVDPAPASRTPGPAGPAIDMDALGFELEGGAVDVDPAPAPRTPAPAGPAIDMDALGFELEGEAVDLDPAPAPGGPAVDMDSLGFELEGEAIDLGAGAATSDSAPGGPGIEFAFDDPAPAAQAPQAVPAIEVEIDAGGFDLDLEVEVAPGPVTLDPAAPIEEDSAQDLRSSAPTPPPMAPQAPRPGGGPPVMGAPPVIGGPPVVGAGAAPAPAPARRPGELVFIQPPQQIPETGPVIGIDLGTTNSCIAVVKDGKPTIVKSREGYHTTPSMVAVSNKGKLMVGHRAKGQILTNPTQTVFGAKRLVGRPFDSAVTREVAGRFPYEVCGDYKGLAAVKLEDDVLSLAEVQALVLQECRDVAQNFLEEPVHRAVITVPAYYSEPQRNAVREAAKLAGLRAERILNEPTSAALAYGLNRSLTKKVLVYDLGGGTFDATVLQLKENVFEVLATGGDTFLGGTDFDNQLVDHLLEAFQKQNGVPFNGDRFALSRVQDAVEHCKAALSERSDHEIQVPFLMVDEGGKPFDLRCTVTRDELEALTVHLIDRTMDVVRDVLLDAQVKASEIDDIILVGGQSRMPLIRSKIRDAFGKEAHAGVHADEAVAVGAALFGAAAGGVSDVVLIDVLPMTIGVGLPGGEFRRVIERNSQLPTERTFTMATTRDGQTELEISVFQGEDPHVSANEYLGTVTIPDLPRGPAGQSKVMITLRVDAECVLHADVRDLSTRKQIKATLATRYTPEQLQQRLGYDAAKASEAQAKRAAEIGERSGRLGGLLRRIFGFGKG